MSNAKSLGLLTAKLSQSGQQRLFEFLDVVDTETAARFRAWLSTAPDTELGAAADLLNRMAGISPAGGVPTTQCQPQKPQAPRPIDIIALHSNTYIRRIARGWRTET